MPSDNSGKSPAFKPQELDDILQIYGLNDEYRKIIIEDYSINGSNLMDNLIKNYYEIEQLKGKTKKSEEQKKIWKILSRGRSSFSKFKEYRGPSLLGLFGKFSSGYKNKSERVLESWKQNPKSPYSSFEEPKKPGFFNRLKKKFFTKTTSEGGAGKGFFKKGGLKKAGVGLAVVGLLYVSAIGIKNTDFSSINNTTTGTQEKYNHVGGMLEKKQELEEKLGNIELELSHSIQKGDNLYDISKKYAGDNWREALKDLTSSLGKDYPYSEEGRKWFDNGRHILTNDKENPHFLSEKVNGQKNTIDISQLDAMKEKNEKYNEILAKKESLEKRLEKNNNGPGNNVGVFSAVGGFFSYLAFSTIAYKIKNREGLTCKKAEYAGTKKEEIQGHDCFKQDDSMNFNKFENDKKLQKKIDTYIDYLKWWDERFNKESKIFNPYARHSAFDNVSNLAKKKGIAKSTLYNYVNWVEDNLVNHKGYITDYLKNKIVKEYEGT